MTEQDVQAYDAAAAKLQEQLKTLFPGYTWRVPTSDDALFSLVITRAIHDGWLYAAVSHEGYGARLPVTVGIELDCEAVRVVGLLAISIMEKARQNDIPS